MNSVILKNHLACKHKWVGSIWGTICEYCSIPKPPNTANLKERNE